MNYYILKHLEWSEDINSPAKAKLLAVIDEKVFSGNPYNGSFADFYIEIDNLDLDFIRIVTTDDFFGQLVAYTEAGNSIKLDKCNLFLANKLDRVKYIRMGN